MDLWTKLTHTDKPIVLYGMGNGADKILAHAEKCGIRIAGVFASDAFVRGQSFHGMPVLTYRSAKDRFGSMVVLLSFASPLPEVIAAVEAIAAAEELYVPDLPVAGDTVFDAAFYQANASKFAQARALLADDASKMLFDGITEGKLQGSLPTLLQASLPRAEMFREVLHPARWQRYLDLGAYDGDTVLEFLQYAPHALSITALEPDPKNFRRLQANLEKHGLTDRVKAIEAAAWREEATLFFDASGNRNAGLHTPGKKRLTVCGMPPDSFVGADGVDLIKYDVEGAERDAILGTADTIQRFHPDLIVSCYHRSEDLFDLPLLLQSLTDRYRFFLRRTRCLPAWEISLLAVSS